MGLQTTIKEDLKAALKEGNSEKVGVLRLLSAALHNREIEKRAKGSSETLTEEEVIRVFVQEAKKRREAMEAFLRGKREDLVRKEAAELEIIKKYLPPEMGKDEVERAVEDILTRNGAADFAGGMRAVMGELKGKADAKLIADAVKRKLGS